MVRKCGKLPLAISLLGGILSKKKSTREWELVNDNISAHLYTGEGLENVNDEIHGVLKLSYEELPCYLKSCFLYMGQYEKDELINVDELCTRWIAQGMISHDNQPNEENLMEIGQHYLGELASRCVVEIVHDLTPGRMSRMCKLHDVVRELCLSIGKYEDFGLQILDCDGRKFSSSFPHAKTRHLFVNFVREIEQERQHEKLTIASDEDNIKLVRSLHFRHRVDKKTVEFPEGIIDLKKFPLLKVLVFDRLHFVRRKLPREVGKLVHLRYLSFQECEFDELTSSISNLVYLHTLDLRSSVNIRIANNVLRKMSQLKHLFLPSYNTNELERYRLRLEGLDELETLYGFNSLVHELKFVTELKNIRTFEGVIYDNKILLEFNHAVSIEWKNMRYCKVQIRQDCHLSSPNASDDMNFKKLFTCPNLHNLGINVPIGKMFQELENQVYTSNLIFLNLKDCEIEDDPMDTLGKLPLLRDLFLLGTSFMGEKMACRSFGFPSLKVLVLEDLPNLREWRVEEGAMSVVVEILIDSCPHLEMALDGLGFLIALKTLSIGEMPEFGKRLVDKVVVDFERMQHVPSILLYSHFSSNGGVMHIPL